MSLHVIFLVIHAGEELIALVPHGTGVTESTCLVMSEGTLKIEKRIINTSQAGNPQSPDSCRFSVKLFDVPAGTKWQVTEILGKSLELGNLWYIGFLKALDNQGFGRSGAGLDIMNYYREYQV